MNGTKHLNILIVDDEEISLRTIRRALESLDQAVFTATDAAEAQEIISSGRHIDVICSDVRMPGMNGIEFIKRLRDQHLKTPVIFITGILDDREMTEIAHIVSCRILYKPFEIEVLHETILHLTTTRVAA